MSNKEIREAKDELYRLSMDEKERALYFIGETRGNLVIAMYQTEERKRVHERN